MYKQIHIVGCSPRSGTTLLYEMMSACCHFDKLYGHETRFNRTQASDGQTLLTKRPKDTQFMPRVLASVPEFWVIYCLRDPRDVVVSKHRIAGDKYYSNLRLWREQHGFAQRMQTHERCITVRYEDLVRDPDAVQSMLQKQIPWLTCTHPFSEYHQHAKLSAQSERAMHGLRSINTDSIGRWRDNLPRIVSQIQRHGDISALLIECGYEADTSWMNELEGIQPDHSPSRYPDRKGLWNQIRQGGNIALKVAAYRFNRWRRGQL
ncbi:sulfotransferase family protein [Aequoribacter fuscus]|uniref:sulfotransferase family protein n=1 Tax=Aequoribacter fuscus TaxID=2518989 RepID=UPI0009FBB426|nr:sulfotransferase [Aequoribacter fuscus]QHJ88551.1 sulfotransferase family protein [Aequoribacter fuscus]